MEVALKKECGRQGGALLLYKLIMNVCVISVALAGAILFVTRQMALEGYRPEKLSSWAAEAVSQYINSGVGYLLAIAVSVGLLLLWKKPAFFRDQVLKKRRPMKLSTFLALLSLFMSAQFLAQIGMWIADLFLSQWDISISDYMQQVGVTTDRLSMFLYVGLGAPIFEELLFRGYILRSLAPYGKRMAVLVSALTFGLFHGNPVQTVYAFAVGILLGYVALEFHICWAMALHIFNNLIFADALPRLLQALALPGQELILLAVMMVFFLAGLCVLLVKYRQVAQLLRGGLISLWQTKAVLTSPWMLVFIGSCVLDMVLFVIMMLRA